MNTFSHRSFLRPLRGARQLLLALTCSALLVACKDDTDVVDRPDLAAANDASVIEGRDLSTTDASSADAGRFDAGPADGGAPDGGIRDAGVPDALPGDASVPKDGGLPDARVPDAGVPDAVVPDASVPDAGIPDASRDGTGGGTDLAGTPVRLRIMGANISSGTKQSYDPGEGIRIFQGIKPDIALMQEFNYGDNTDATVRGFVDSTFGSSYYYFRESGAQIPNGVVSRYPILAAGKWTDPKVANRSFVWAHIDIPGPTDLWAVSVHLLTSSAANRQAEAAALVAELKKVVGASEYIVIGGDFNSDARTEACVVEFAAIMSTAAPYPADRLGNENTNAARAKPYDWVLTSANLRLKQTPVVIGGSSFPSGLVVDTRVYTPISEIAPALTTDSAATNMQHMATVKDFLLP